MDGGRTCAGCGEALEDGRSVCPSCGRLNSTAPIPPGAAAPGGDPTVPRPGAPGWTPQTPGGAPSYPPPNPPGYVPPATPGYLAPTAYGDRPMVAPMPKRGGGAVTGVLVAVAIALVVGLAIFGLVVITSGEDDQADRTTSGGSTTTEAAPATAPTTTTAPPPAVRSPVDAGGVRWTMRGDLDSQQLDLPVPGGGLIRTTVWSGTVTDADIDGAAVYELAGQAYSTDDGLRGAVAQTGGSIQSGPGPITIDGRPGQMVVSTFPAGASGFARYAIVQVGDRAFLWFSAAEGSDPSAGEQAFADLIASIQID